MVLQRYVVPTTNPRNTFFNEKYILDDVVCTRFFTIEKVKGIAIGTPLMGSPVVGLFKNLELDWPANSSKPHCRFCFFLD